MDVDSANVLADVKTHSGKVRRTETRVDEIHSPAPLEPAIGEITTATSTATKPPKLEKRKREDDASKQPNDGTDNDHKVTKVSKQNEGQEEKDNDDMEAELSVKYGNTQKGKKSKEDTMVKKNQTSAESRTENEDEASVRVAVEDVAAASEAVKKALIVVDEWNARIRSSVDNQDALRLFMECLDQANESLKNANESLKNAQNYHLQLKQNDRQEAVIDVAALKAVERASKFVAAIVNDDCLQDIPNSNGMKVMRNVPDLETGEKSVTFVIRSITEKFWQACIETVAVPKHRVCAVGTPGVGKTSSIPYLIRMLLRVNNCVVYLIRSVEKTKWYYEFTRTNKDKVDVAVYPERKRTDEIPSLNDSSTYYIVDPSMTKDSCVPDYMILAKFILVSSPFEAHWGHNQFGKSRYGHVGFLHYYPIWKLDELMHASTILEKNLTEEQIHERYREFGGVPSLVWSNTSLELNSNRAAYKTGLASLTAEMAESLNSNKMDSVATFASETKSAVIGLDSSEEEKFLVGVPIMISALVYEQVCIKYMTILWNRTISEEVYGRTLFEAYTRLLMTAPNENKSFVARPCVGVTDMLRNDQRFLLLGGCSSIRLAINIVDAAKKRKGVLFHSTDKRHPLIDFIYQDNGCVFHAFQATLGKKHDADADQIEALEKLIFDAHNKLRLYYLVPAKNFPTFVTNLVKPNATCSVYHVMVPNPGEEHKHPKEEEVKPEEEDSIRVEGEDSKPVEEDDSKAVEEEGSKAVEEEGCKPVEQEGCKPVEEEHSKA